QTLLPETEITKQKTISDSTTKWWLNVLEEMDKYEPYMASYERETMDKILPNLQNSEKEHILVTHDKCIFYSNDGKQVCGRLKLNAQTIENYPNIPQEACVY
ncbi:16833_t:CDS:2, partial [Rhizophagus irregularis]